MQWQPHVSMVEMAKGLYFRCSIQWNKFAFECGESKYGIFLIEPFLIHIFGIICSKKATIRWKSQLENRAKLDPKMTISRTKSDIIQPKTRAVKADKENMALGQTFSRHIEEWNFRDVNFVATMWLKPLKTHFFDVWVKRE